MPFNEEELNRVTSEIKNRVNLNVYQRNDNGEYVRTKDDYNYAFLQEDTGYSKEWKELTAVLNGLKGTVRNIANTGIALDKLNESEAQKEQTLGINMPLAFRALYTAGNVLGGTGREQTASLEEVAKAPLLKRIPVKGDTALGQFGLDLLENTPQVVTQVGLSVATGPATATAFMGTQIAGSQYERLNAEGVKFEDMKLPLIANVVGQSILERTGMGKVLAKVPGGKGYLQKFTEIIKRGVEEGFTEALQEFPEGVSDIIAKNPNASIGELTDEIVKAFPEMSKDAVYSGLIGSVFGGGFGGLKVLADSTNKRIDKEIHREQLSMLEEGAERIKKSGADPVYAASVVNANLQGEFVQVDGETLYHYAQTQNINDVAETLGLEQDDIVQAAKTGQTIDISVGNFEAMVAKNADFMDAVKDGITFEDDGYSVNNERLQKEIAKEYQKVKYNLDEFENWKTKKINELRQSGATKQETLQTIVLMESAARTQYPDDPMQYFRDHPVSFKRVVSTPDGRYMQTKSASERLLQDEKNFVDNIDKFMSGQLVDKTIRVMQTPLALEVAGAKILPVDISVENLDKVLNGKHKSDMSADIVKQIPRALTDPLMIFDTYDGKNGAKRKIVALDLKSKNGATIVVPFELEVDNKSNKYVMNEIISAYGKTDSKTGEPRYEWFAKQIENGKLRYINKEKTAKLIENEKPEWLMPFSTDSGFIKTDKLLQSPSSDSASRITDLDSLLNNSIPDENALRKRREEMQGYYQTEGKTKGAITWDAEGKAIINLFEGADVSTVIHEAMGHYLSVNIMRQSKLPTATEQQRKDRQTLLEYAETSEEEWAELDKYDGYLTKEQFERKTAIYERWATGAEQYFMLGVAPNKELRRIFANCKKWLLGIYKSIRDFVAVNKYAKEITPEVKAVFDRALASEEAIREQQKLDGYFAKLPDTILDNLSETSKRRLEAIIENAYDKAVESLTKESLKNFTKERRAEINAYRDKIAPTITESIQTERLYITGRQMTETLGEKSAATSAQKYQDLIGRAKNPEEVLTDKEQEYMLLFSAVAEQNGYASGEDFAKAVLENPTEAQAIENAIDKVVDEKFPDIVNERQAAELATKEAFYNDESGLVLGIEQQIIEDAAVGLLAKQRSTEAKMKLAKARRQQAKSAAVKMIDGMSIKDAVRVQKFIVAERNAAAKAAVAVRDGDMETALTQKRLQALNHALVMESMKTRLAVDKAGRALKRAKNAKKETWFNDNHLSQAGALFARMGIKLKGYDLENKKMTLGQYVNTMNELLGNADIAEWLFDETVDISNPTALTRQQYFDVVDAIKNIRALAKQEKGVDLLETKKDFNEFKTETLTRLQDLKTVEKLAPGEKAKINLIRKGIAQGLTSDSIYEILDKGKQGFFYNNLYLPLKHKLDLESVDLAYLTKWFETASKNWKEAVGDVYAKASYSELGVDIDGEPLKIDRTNLVKMLVYSGTQDSFRRLCDTPPVGLENSPLWVRASDTVSDEAARQATAENILSFLSNNLTSHDVVMAQELINIAEYKWSEKAENEQQTKGFAPKKQEATPRELVLADGNTVIFRGGYFPLVRDTRGGSTPTGNTPFAETNEPQLKYGMHTNTGSMKARTVGAKYPVDLTLDAGMREINASIHDLHFRKVIQGANRIFNDKDITSLMRAKLGTATFKALKEQIEVTARPEGMYNTSAAESFIGDIADKLRGKVIPYMIGMSLKINTQNLANIALYGNNVEGYGHIEALQDFITNGIMLGINSPRAAREMWKTVQELSPMMAERFKGTDFTTRELMEKNKFDGVTKKVLEWSNMSMAFTDGLTAMPIWYGAYTRQMNTGKTQQEAIDYADSIIRKTMGSTRATDVSSMVRAKGATKIFFMFQTFFNTQFNQWYTTFKHQELNLSDKEYKKIAKEVSSFVFAKWVTFTLFSLLLAGENPFVDDDDDDYNDFLSELFSYPFTLGGPIGQGVNFGVRRMFDMQTFPYRISPIESSLNTVFTSTSTIGKVVRGEKENEELVEPVVNLALLAKGLPSQLSKWFFNAWDILYNDMDPRVDDLFRRRPKRERD
ncbi:hypothetical protein CE91St52_05910 [Phascolarctobacterium faecium]|uniref:MuF-C-terminal domain-containing protein n=1 Tax=Phascolarctobacterium faecium TaxID=33025 RepID=UPI001FCCA56E|nr:hypothetical protein [Phascolarctobacterium faecium]BDE83814.1 hypothetical protein CE91St52_05910 [Phascolarctobacterium faecium]BDE92939.1 hypothetical protein CE91St53_05910 [Phascolarctobacterium faecium]